MSDDRRTVEIVLKAEISDLTGSMNAAATSVDTAANKIESAGKKADAGVKASTRSAGLMSRTMSSLGQANRKLLATTNALARHREQVDKIGTSWMVAGGVLTASVAGSVMVMVQFDKAMSGVAATGEDARNNLDRLSQAAIQAGTSTAYGATEAANGITQLLKAGLSADDVISGGLSASLNLAAADNLDLATSSEIVATALSQFGMSGRDAAHVADLLAAGAGKAQGGVEDLANGLKYIGPVAHGMNVSIDDTVGALSALASQGILSEQAGTSLRGVLSSLTSPSKLASAEIKRLGISLYDQNGKFLGLSNAAGQLDKAYAKMTDKQRDASLGVIFGNAQLTTARILFSQGAEGIQGWTDKVNDSGYASRAAAIQLDNLAGDFKKLKGAAEAAAITSGGGLNGFLRDTTQGATSLVRSVNSVPAPVLEAGARLTALVGIGLLAGGGLLKVATSAAEAKKSMALLRLESPRLASGLEKTSKMAKAAGIALAALQVASIFGGTAQSDVDKLNGSLGDMGYAAGSAAGAGGLASLDAEFSKVQSRLFFWRTGTAQAKDFGSAIKQVADNSEGFLAFHKNLSQFIAGLTGSKIATVELDEQMAKLDSSLASMDPIKAKTAFAQITTAARDQGVSVEKLSQMFPNYRASLQQVATQLGVSELSAQDWVDWMGGKVPAAVKAAADAQPSVVSGLDKTTQAALDGKDALAQLTEALWDYANAKLKLSGSKIGFEGAIDDAASTIKGNKKKRGKGTKVGNSTSMDYAVNRENKKALDDLAASTQTYINALVEQKGKGEEAANAMQRARDSYIASAVAAGYSGDKAKQMADEMGLIPENVRSDVTLEGAEAAKAQASTLKDAIKGLPKKQQSQIESKFKKEGITEAYVALAKIDKKKADAWIISMLNKGAINSWDKYKPETKRPKIDPTLTRSSVTVRVNVKGGRIAVADGGLFQDSPKGLVQRFANGGEFAGSIGTKQPQIQLAGGAGLNWAEDGAGPWEAFISGHPGKRDRSRAIATTVVSRLGGVAHFADGDLIGRPQAYTGAFRRSMEQPTTVINYNIRTTTYNPQAEPTSVTNNRALATAANMGR